MISIKNLTKFYDQKQALKGISFDVKPGEIIGFLGPNGAGKSTTVKILTGLIAPSEGTATINGFDIIAQPNDVKRSFGYVPESGALYESLSGWEYLELVADLHHLDKTVFEKRANEFLELFGLQDDKFNRLSDYSKGMKQKILISAALIHNPSVLFFDEPLNGVDANTALVFKKLIQRLSQQGKTIFFCSHILEVVERLCTRIIIIHQGQVLIDGTPEQIVGDTKKESLEAAFNSITGYDDADKRAESFIAALQGLRE